MADADNGKIVILSDEQQARLVDEIVKKWDNHLGKFFGTSRFDESYMRSALERATKGLFAPGGFLMDYQGDSRLQPVLNRIVNLIKP